MRSLQLSIHEIEFNNLTLVQYLPITKIQKFLVKKCNNRTFYTTVTNFNIESVTWLKYDFRTTFYSKIAVPDRESRSFFFSFLCLYNITFDQIPSKDVSILSNAVYHQRLCPTCCYAKLSHHIQRKWLLLDSKFPVSIFH